MDRIQAPERLRKRIISRIGREERRRARIYLVSSCASIALSLAGIVFTTQYLIQSFYQSSFYSYLSILFSDPDIALMYWKELVLSLIETVPLLEITLCLIAIAALLASVRMFAINVRGGLTPSFTS